MRVYKKIKAHYVAELTIQYDFFVKFIITASASKEGSDEHVHAQNPDWGFAAFKRAVYDRKTFLALLHAAFIFPRLLSTPATWKISSFQLVSVAEQICLVLT